MILMMRCADYRHGLTGAKLLTEHISCKYGVDGAAQVECGNLVEAQQVKRSGELLAQHSDECGAECGIVPSPKPRADPVSPYTQTIGRFEKSLERIAWIFGRVLFAREPLFFVIADEPYSPLAGCLHERDPGIVHAATGDASEINRRTTIKFGAYRAKAPRRECTVEPVDAVAGVNPLQKRQNKLECCPPEPRVKRSNSSRTCTHLAVDPISKGLCRG